MVEDWRWYEAISGMIKIEGSATCDKGRIRIRAYDKEGDGQQFLGTAQGLVRGHAFSATILDVVKPDSLAIRYSIEPR